MEKESGGLVCHQSHQLRPKSTILEEKGQKGTITAVVGLIVRILMGQIAQEAQEKEVKARTAISLEIVRIWSEIKNLKTDRTSHHHLWVELSRTMK